MPIYRICSILVETCSPALNNFYPVNYLDSEFQILISNYVHCTVMVMHTWAQIVSALPVKSLLIGDDNSIFCRHFRPQILNYSWSDCSVGPSSWKQSTLWGRTKSPHSIPLDIWWKPDAFQEPLVLPVWGRCSALLSCWIVGFVVLPFGFMDLNCFNVLFAKPLGPYGKKQYKSL